MNVFIASCYCRSTRFGLSRSDNFDLQHLLHTNLYVSIHTLSVTNLRLLRALVFTVPICHLQNPGDGNVKHNLATFQTEEKILSAHLRLQFSFRIILSVSFFFFFFSFKCKRPKLFIRHQSFREKC